MILSGCTGDTDTPIEIQKETQETPPSVENEKKKFSMDDKPFGILSRGMSEEEIVAALNQPNRKEDVLQENRGGISRYYHYSGFSLELRPDTNNKYLLESVNCKEQGKEFIRGLSVGSTKDDVLMAFPPGDEEVVEMGDAKWISYDYSIESEYEYGVISFYLDASDKVENIFWRGQIPGVD
jgi:hypothetical protein